jgi:hypothetical protein
MDGVAGAERSKESLRISYGGIYAPLQRRKKRDSREAEGHANENAYQ